MQCEKCGDEIPTVVCPACRATVARLGPFCYLCGASLSQPEEGEEQIEYVMRRRPELRRSPIAPEMIGGLAGCITPRGDLRTLPSDLVDANPRLSGLDGFYAALLTRLP